MDILNPLVEHTMDRDTEITELRRCVADAELRAMKAAQAEDTAQFAFETAKLRGNRLEAATTALLIEKLLPVLPEAAENSVEAIADLMVDDIATGTPFDELDINGHIESYLEGRTEYEADGFTPAELEPPF